MNAAPHARRTPAVALAVLATLAGAALGACTAGDATRRAASPRTGAARPPPPAARARPAAPAPPAAPPACPAPMRPGDPARPTLIVGGENGVLEVDLDGAPVRALTTTPATRPRLLPGGDALVFLVPERGELRHVSRVTCAERVVARLPRDLGVGCGGVWTQRYDPASHVHADEDFVLGPRGDVACLELMDRNLNMASVVVDLQVDLATGATAHRFVASESCGEAGDGAADPAFACLAALSTAAVPSHDGSVAAAFAYRLDENRLLRRGRGGRERVVASLAADGVEVERASPSGRWVVFSANRDEGDYVYRKLFLLDRQTGAVHPLRAGGWPAPLTAAQLASREAFDEAGLLATGETTVRWLPAGELLSVAGLLVDPGRAVVELPGELAL